MKAVSRREIEMVMAWSVDRLGRSLQGLLDVLTELRAKKVDLYLHVQGVDTSTPSGKAMFQMLGVFSEFEREMIRERVYPAWPEPNRRVSTAVGPGLPPRLKGLSWPR